MENFIFLCSGCHWSWKKLDETKYSILDKVKFVEQDL